MSNTQIDSEITITDKAVKEIKRIMDENKITQEFGLILKLVKVIL